MVEAVIFRGRYNVDFSEEAGTTLIMMLDTNGVMTQVVVSFPGNRTEN